MWQYREFVTPIIPAKKKNKSYFKSIRQMNALSLPKYLCIHINFIFSRFKYIIKYNMQIQIVYNYL